MTWEVSIEDTWVIH